MLYLNSRLTGLTSPLSTTRDREYQLVSDLPYRTTCLSAAEELALCDVTRRNSEPQILNQKIKPLVPLGLHVCSTSHTDLWHTTLHFSARIVSNLWYNSPMSAPVGLSSATYSVISNRTFLANHLCGIGGLRKNLKIILIHGVSNGIITSAVTAGSSPCSPVILLQIGSHSVSSIIWRKCKRYSRDLLLYKDSLLWLSSADRFLLSKAWHQSCSFGFTVESYCCRNIGVKYHLRDLYTFPRCVTLRKCEQESTVSIGVSEGAVSAVAARTMTLSSSSSGGEDSPETGA